MNICIFFLSTCPMCSYLCSKMAGTSADGERGTEILYENPRVIRINRRGRNMFFTPTWDRANRSRRGPLGERHRGFCYPNHVVHQILRDRDSYYYEAERVPGYRAETTRWRHNYEAIMEERNYYSQELSRLEQENDDLSFRVSQLEARLQASRARHQRDIGRAQRYRTRVRDHLREALHADVSSAESEGGGDSSDDEEEEEDPSEDEGSIGIGGRISSTPPQEIAAAAADEAPAPVQEAVVIRDIEVDRQD